MASYTGSNSNSVSSSYLFRTLQAFYTKIKALLAGKSDTTHTHSVATSSTNGFMSSADKSKLDGIATGATKTVVDSALSSTSTNPVQNKVVNSALSNINPSNISDGYTNKSFYINTHPENNGTIIPFINNDIAYLLKRGGSASVYYDGVAQSVDISHVFNGSNSYWSVNPTDITEIVIELTLHRIFPWTTIIYVDFGAVGWRSSYIAIDVMNSNSETEWTNKSTITDNAIGQHKIRFSHNNGVGFNKIRFTFSGWNNATIFRIACLGVIGYSSEGLRETFLPKDGGSVYGSITPFSSGTYDLGGSSLKWNNAYANTFNGNLNGNANTATKATQDSGGQQINTTYIKGLSVNGTTITYTKGDNTTGTITTQDSNTTYTAGTGIALTGNSFSNSGVRAVSTGSTNGTVSVNTNGTSTDVAVKGLGSAAYTASTAYAPSSHTHNYAGSSSAGGAATTATTLTGLTSTVAELNFVDGVTSNIQTQLNGKAASSHTHDYITQKGTNTITTTTNDTVGNWGSHMNSVHWYTTMGQLINQPSAYGYLINIGVPGEVHQFWTTQPSGDIFHRGGNGSGWSGSWKTMLDSGNYTTYCAPKYTYGTNALTPGSSSLATGTLYLQYE